MGPTPIPGVESTVTINAVDFSIDGTVLGLTLSRTQIAKKNFGARYGATIGGQRSVQFSAGGDVSVEHVAALVNLFEENYPVAFTLALGTTGGSYTGMCVITQLPLTASIDGFWKWSLSADSTGDVEYDPA